MLTVAIFEPIRGKVYRFQEDLYEDLIVLCAKPEVPPNWGPQELLEYAESRGQYRTEEDNGYKVLRFH